MRVARSTVLSPFQDLLDPLAVQSVCETLAPEDRACARLACRALHDGCREADTAAGGRPRALPFAPFFRSAALAAWCEASQPGGALPHTVHQCACLLAAAEGSVDALRWALAQGYPEKVVFDMGTSELVRPEVASSEGAWANAARVAAFHGHLEVLRWATERCERDGEDRGVCAMAARGGHLEVLRWARAHGCPWDEQTCARAAEGGHLEVLQWARANGCPWDEATCRAAAYGGHAETLQWASANGCPLWDDEDAIALHAAYNNNLGVLQWAAAHGYRRRPLQVRDLAAGGGHLAVLQWLHSLGDTLESETFNMAARRGHLEVVQWLWSIGCPWDGHTCAGAAGCGRLEVLQWLRAQGCPWDESTSVQAAAGGHLEVLQWAVANGCPWNESTSFGAAGHGHLEVLQWARANGCPWNEHLYRAALEDTRYPFKSRLAGLRVRQWLDALSQGDGQAPQDPEAQLPGSQGPQPGPEGGLPL